MCHYFFNDSPELSANKYDFIAIKEKFNKVNWDKIYKISDVISCCIL